MFFIWTLIPALYVCWRLFWHFPCSLPVKVALSALAILGCEFHLLTRLVNGNMFSPELPQSVMVLLGWWFGTLVILACVLLVRDLLWLLLRLCRRPRPALHRGGTGLVALSMLIAGIGIHNAIQVPAVRTVTLHLPALPGAFEGYRIVQLTDIHTSALLRREWVDAVVSRANAIGADLMVLTGDLSDGELHARRDDIAPLARLRAKDGVYAITGNHEYYFDYPAWMQAFQSLGIPFLLNSHITLTRQTGSVVLAGVTDDAATAVGEAGPDLDKALAGADPQLPVILLDHRPLHALRNARKGVMLQLSGHTHGGMIRGLDMAVKPANGGFVSGYYPVAGMALYVSNGAGLWNGFPLRLGRPSEITELILRRGPAAIIE